MAAVDLASKVASLESNIRRLDGSFDRIEVWLFVATAFVVAGLILEYWDELHEIRRFFVLKRQKMFLVGSPHSVGSVFHVVVGAGLVTAGVAWELIEEVQAYRVGIEERRVNTQIVSLLTDEAAANNKIAAQAAENAGHLGVRVGNLQDFVGKQEIAINNAIKDFQ